MVLIYLFFFSQKIEPSNMIYIHACTGKILVYTPTPQPGNVVFSGFEMFHVVKVQGDMAYVVPMFPKMPRFLPHAACRIVQSPCKRYVVFYCEKMNSVIVYYLNTNKIVHIPAKRVVNVYISPSSKFIVLYRLEKHAKWTHQNGHVDVWSVFTHQTHKIHREKLKTLPRQSWYNIRGLHTTSTHIVLQLYLDSKYAYGYNKKRTKRTKRTKPPQRILRIFNWNGEFVKNLELCWTRCMCVTSKYIVMCRKLNFKTDIQLYDYNANLVHTISDVCDGRNDQVSCITASRWGKLLAYSTVHNNARCFVHVLDTSSFCELSRIYIPYYVNKLHMNELFVFVKADFSRKLYIWDLWDQDAYLCHDRNTYVKIIEPSCEQLLIIKLERDHFQCEYHDLQIKKLS